MSTPKRKTKRKKPVHNTPPTNNDGKKIKSNSDSANDEEFLCLVCDEVIIEACDGVEGHEAVFCEGECQGWIHRQCAGLTRPAFNSLSESIPYLCSYCTCARQYNEICSLKDTIEHLTNRLAKFEKSQNPIQVQANPSAVQQPTQQPANQQLRPPHTTDNCLTSLPRDTPTLPRPPQTTPDKKFNVVIFGIKESPSNIPKEMRLMPHLVQY